MTERADSLQNPPDGGSTTYAVLAEFADPDALEKELLRETSGDLMHLLAPLDYRSCCGKDRDFLQPQLSASWWFTQGVNQYFGWLAAVRDSFVAEEEFMGYVSARIRSYLTTSRKPLTDLSVFLKRGLDLGLAVFGLIVLAPLFAAVAVAIKLESAGPVIYRQARRGFNGETFMIWKFRSMRVVESGYQMKQAQKNDPRITRIGRFIRATSIDELPQLVNVLTGQMSLVGPRPHAVSHDEELSHELAVYAHRQRIKPGITGWAQVHGFRGETATRAQIEGRVEHDIYYIDNWSIFLDIWIFVLTVFHPAARRNAR